MSDCRACHAPTDGFLCKPCGAQLARDLGDMPSLLEDLDDVVNRQARVYRSSPAQRPDEQQHDDPERDVPAYLRTRDGRVTLRATAMPVNLDAAELRWEAVNTLTTWARDLVESTGAVMVEPWLVWLADSAESFRFAEQGPQALDEIGHLHRRLVSAVDRSPSRLYAGPCHATTDELDGFIEVAGVTVPVVVDGRCQRDLYGWPNADTIECDGHRGDEQGCASVHSADERRQWLLDAVEDQLLPLAVLTDASMKLLGFCPPREVVKKWRQRDALVPRTVINGEPLYRGGDWVELCERWLTDTRKDRRVVA